MAVYEPPPTQSDLPDFSKYSREELLETAKNIVTKDRNNTYGEPEDAFQVIADYWSVYLKNKYNIQVSSSDVALMMNLMKIARLTQSPTHHDSITDAIGYLACYGETIKKNF